MRKSQRLPASPDFSTSVYSSRSALSHLCAVRLLQTPSTCGGRRAVKAKSSSWRAPRRHSVYRIAHAYHKSKDLCRWRRASCSSYLGTNSQATCGGRAVQSKPAGRGPYCISLPLRDYYFISYLVPSSLPFPFRDVVFFAPVVIMTTTRPAEVNNGVTTSWIPFTTPGTSAPAECSSQIYREPGTGDILAFNPYYQQKIPNALQCLPTEVVQSWAQSTAGATRLSLGPFNNCPSLYYKAATASVNTISTIVACCPS
jgi:hypothetical protein